MLKQHWRGLPCSAGILAGVFENSRLQAGATEPRLFLFESTGCRAHGRSPLAPTRGRAPFASCGPRTVLPFLFLFLVPEVAPPEPSAILITIKQPDGMSSWKFRIQR